jgi:hypothetical protein
MLSLQFNIKNPYSSRFGIVSVKHGKITKNKSWEFQIDKTNDIIGFEVRLTTRQCHSGFWLSLALFGYEVIFNIHDNRHWDYLTNTWETYTEEEQHHAN